MHSPWRETAFRYYPWVLSAGASPHTILNHRKSITLFSRNQPTSSGTAGHLDTSTCHPLQPPLFYYWDSLIKTQPRWLAWSSEYNQNRRETCWVSRIKGTGGIQEVMWFTCFAAGKQWHHPRLMIVWGQRLHKASKKFLTVLPYVSPNSLVLLLFLPSHLVSLYCGASLVLLKSQLQGHLERPWDLKWEKVPLEMLCGTFCRQRQTMLYFGSFLPCLNVRQLYFPHQFPGTVFPGQTNQWNANTGILKRYGRFRARPLQ